MNNTALEQLSARLINLDPLTRCCNTTHPTILNHKEVGMEWDGFKYYGDGLTSYIEVKSFFNVDKARTLIHKFSKLPHHEQSMTNFAIGLRFTSMAKHIFEDNGVMVRTIEFDKNEILDYYREDFQLPHRS